MRSEVRRLHVLLVNYLSPGVAHVLECILEFSLGDACSGLKLFKGVLRLLVELEKHHGLVAADHELVRFSGYIHWTKLDTAIVEEP